GVILVCAFVFPDLALIPDSLKSIYIDIRLFFQLPICLIVFAFTFFKFYQNNHNVHQFTICVAVLLLIYSNYWFIWVSWQQQGFAFPYEGTVIYSLFVLFVFRIQFRYSLIFVLIAALGFAALVATTTVYGDRNLVYLGFVASGLFVGVIGVHQIEKALQQLSVSNQKLTTLSQIDRLSAIYNRGAYEDKFNELLEISKRRKDQLCIFMIDLDNFKSFNDGYGHLKGDDIIKLQAKLLRSIFRRNTDIVARYGGEEFVVVTCNLDLSQCVNSAQKIVDEWAKLKIPHGKIASQMYVSCSVGFNHQTVDKNTTKESLVDGADKALYRAKDNGRNQFIQYTD
ncbi:GGDEF domain-containing protein, partial [Paraglaciecola sp.]|uniref:GGDEF domain-containing protein n=1 Tax=Paraglaciecola sp. TaxID=1920173 RepID=UPI003EF2075D